MTMTMTHGETTYNVSINSIIQDASFQVRSKLDQSAIRRYTDAIRSGQSFPAVTLGNIDGKLLLIDGWHRLAAYRNTDAHFIDAQVLDVTESEARWLAADANTKHGLPLKSSEIREVFRAYVHAGKHRDERGCYRSYRDIAAVIGKAHNTIRNWMQSDFPSVFRAMSDGREDDHYNDEWHTPEIDETRHVIESVRGLFLSSVDDRFRGEVIDKVERLLGDMKASGNWTPVGPDDF